MPGAQDAWKLSKGAEPRPGLTKGGAGQLRSLLRWFERGAVLSEWFHTCLTCARHLEVGLLPAALRKRGGQKGSAPKYHDSSEEAGQRWLFFEAAASGWGRAGQADAGLTAPRWLPASPQAQGLLTEMRVAVCTDSFQDSFRLRPLESWAGETGADKCWRLPGSLEVAARGWIECAVTRHIHRCGWRLGQLVAPATALRSTTSSQSPRGAPRARGFYLAVCVRESATTGC